MLYELAIGLLIIPLTVQYFIVFARIFDPYIGEPYKTKKEFWISLIPLSILYYVSIIIYKGIINLSKEFSRIYKELK